MTDMTDDNGSDVVKESDVISGTKTAGSKQAAGKDEQSDKPTVIVQQSSKQSFWILMAVVTGFILPVVACGLTAGFVFFAAGVGSAFGGTAAGIDAGSGPAVAVVRVEGAIIGTDDTNYVAGAGSGTVIADLKSAEENDDVKAIVLRVDSPGGTVTGSAQIHEHIRDNVSKPVIVSMASTAASGGYYISAAADYIFARADTTTGSLGVIVSIFNVSELMDEWGVDVVNLASGPNKAIASPYDEMTPEHLEILQVFIDESYDQFVNIIVDGRGLEEAAVRQLADGRIYSGRQALELGLVDELGNFADAIAHAADVGGITDDPRIIEYERVPGFEDLISTFSQAQGRTTASEIKSTIDEYGLPKVEYRYMGP